MAFHSIFEGLAIGLETTLNGLILLVIGICLHKFAEAFAMGMNFVKIKLNLKRSLLLLIIFSIVCPIGIAIGLALGTSLDSNTQTLVSSLLNGFAVGVFMYVSILGIFVEEFLTGSNLLIKFALAIVGCIAMGCLSFLE